MSGSLKSQLSQILSHGHTLNRPTCLFAGMQSASISGVALVFSLGAGAPSRNLTRSWNSFLWCRRPGGGDAARSLVHEESGERMRPYHAMSNPPIKACQWPTEHAWNAVAEDV